MGAVAACPRLCVGASVGLHIFSSAPVLFARATITITMKKPPRTQRTRNPQVRPLGLPLPTRRTLTQPNPDWGITTRTPPKRQTERKGYTPKNYPARTEQ